MLRVEHRDRTNNALSSSSSVSSTAGLRLEEREMDKDKHITITAPAGRRQPKENKHHEYCYRRNVLRADNDMPTRMLEGLLVQNGDRPDVDPSALAAMRAELEARKSKQR
jgi:hypothetical protein